MIANKFESVAQTTLLSQSVCGFKQVTNETVIILHARSPVDVFGAYEYSSISWLCTGRAQAIDHIYRSLSYHVF